LDQLAAVVADDAAQEDALGAGGLDRGCDRLVARRARVPTLGPLDLDPELLRRAREEIRDALAVRLLVGQDVDGLQLHRLLGEQGIRGALELVTPDDARVVALARGVVHLRLTGGGSWTADGESR